MKGIQPFPIHLVHDRN